MEDLNKLKDQQIEALQKEVSRLKEFLKELVEEMELERNTKSTLK